MSKRVVTTEAAPQPVGPYSQAVVAGGFVFVSGQVPLDPTTGKLIESDQKICCGSSLKSRTCDPNQRPVQRSFPLTTPDTSVETIEQLENERLNEQR